ncbi:MAG TPA: toast rack family protein [Vicinamibacterales bacterium]|nr:toast rack family protein [Vicinamibacterales bacterium]
MTAGAAAVATAIWTAAWTAACVMGGSPAGPVVNEHHSVERGAATQARVEIDMSPGDLEVRSGAKPLFSGDFAFNVPELKPDIQYAVNGGTGALKVTQGSASGNYENRWRLSLDDTTPLDVVVSLGAGDADLVLGSVNLNSLTVRLGAGDLKIDLRGKPTKSYNVSVQAGAGDTTIELPSSVGISATTSGLIGDSSVSGLEKRGDRWINTRAEGSPVTIDVQVQHAVGDLRIRAD